MKQARLRALEHQVQRLRQCLARLNRSSVRYSWFRLVAFGVGVLATGLTLYLGGPWLAALSAVAGGAFFGLAVYVHRRVNHSIRRHQLWLQAKSGHLARALLDWKHIPATFHHPPEPGHPFEADLNLIGEWSLQRLIDTAVTYEGSQRLRAWLTAPVPDVQQIARRQGLVRELVPLNLFRERLAVNGRRPWAPGGLGAQTNW